MIAFVIEKLADGPDASIHHVGRRHHVRSGLNVRQRRTLQQLERQVVDNVLPLHDSAMAVVSIFAQTDVGDHDKPWRCLFDGAHGLLHRAVGL